MSTSLAPPRHFSGQFRTDLLSRAVYAEDPDGNVVELWTWDVANHLRQRS